MFQRYFFLIQSTFFALSSVIWAQPKFLALVAGRNAENETAGIQPAAAHAGFDS